MSVLHTILYMFIKGTKYSEALNAIVTNQAQKRVHLEMGCYGIGVTRILAAVAETFNDDKGIKWPQELAPYLMCIISTGRKKEIDAIHAHATELYDSLQVLCS